MMGYVAWTSGASDEFYLVALLGLMVFLREPFGVIIAWFQSKALNRTYSLLGLCTALIKLGLVCLLYYAGVANKIFYGAAWLLEALLLALALLIVYRQDGMRFVAKWNLGSIKPLFMAGLPFWFAMVSMYVFLRMDRLLIKEYRSVAELGAYSAVMQISENLTMVAASIATAAAPLIVFNAQNQRDLKFNVAKLTLGMFGLGLLGALVSIPLSPYVIKLLFGAAFADAAPMLVWSLFAASLVFADAGLNTYLLKTYGGARVLNKWIVALLVGGAVDIIFIPKLGGYGAIMGFASGYLAAICTGVYWMFKPNQGTVQ
jgi:PST family polysaccharide transporter